MKRRRNRLKRKPALSGLLKKFYFRHREPVGGRDLDLNRMLDAWLRRRSDDVAPRNDRFLGFFNPPCRAGSSFWEREIAI